MDGGPGLIGLSIRSPADYPSILTLGTHDPWTVFLSRHVEGTLLRSVEYVGLTSES